MSWLTSLGLLLGVIGAGLFRIPNLPWYRLRRFVYRFSPRVRHYQKIDTTFTFVLSARRKEPFVLFSQTSGNDLPYEISEKTARILYGVLKSTNFYSPLDKEKELQSVCIDNGKFSFSVTNEADYHIPFDEGVNRFQIAKNGFLNEYYTGKGALFLMVGFMIQFIEALPPF